VLAESQFGGNSKFVIMVKLRKA